MINAQSKKAGKVGADDLNCILSSKSRILSSNTAIESEIGYKLSGLSEEEVATVEGFP